MTAVVQIVRRPLLCPLLPDLPPVLARVYAARDLRSATELDCSLARLLPPASLHGIDAAAALLLHALTHNHRIVVIADFDADGATACAVAVRALRAFGATDVHYLVPNRFAFGYGLTPEIVAVAAQLRPQLLITVDNGISSIAGVAAARAQGMAVLITDHHLPGAELPAADAIVNPNQSGDTFASKSLAGVGVIFYVMLALRATLRAADWFRAKPEPNLACLLDLVALGTVADVVPLDHNNRILVAQGLARINARQASAGVAALLAVAGRAPGNLRAADLSFGVAPRLNAAGRLEDMAIGIECLLCDDPARAMTLAQTLDRLNRERRAIETEMQQQAALAVADLRLDGELPAGVCLMDPSWHQGVIGIVAGRLKDSLHRPVIAFAPGGDGVLKGSARSISGFHIRDALAAIAAQCPDLIQKFGGHAMAAGLTLSVDKFPAFAAAFAAEAARQLDGDALTGRVLSDGSLHGEPVDLAFAQHLHTASPWGQAFPEPLFDDEFTVVEHRWLQDKHLRLRLRARDERPLEAIAFNCAERPVGARIHAAYSLDINEYQGSRSLQLRIVHWR